MDERGGLRRVGRAQSLVVPLDLFPRPVGHVAEVVRFGRPAAVLEVRARDRTVPLGVIDPLDPMAGGAGQRFSYNLNTLNLISENYTAGILYVYQFKVVIFK